MGTRSIVSPTVSVAMTTTVRNTANADTQTVSVSQGRTDTYTFTSGTTDSKFDRAIEFKDRDITSASSETIDLYDLGSLDVGAGAGLDAAGQDWTITELVGIHVTNNATSVGDLILGGDGTTAAFNSIFNASDTAEILLRPSGSFMMATTSDAAWAVADTTNHLLKVAASGGDINYDITFFTRSA